MNQNNQFLKGAASGSQRPFTEQDWKDLADVMDFRDHLAAETAYHANMVAPAAPATPAATGADAAAHHDILDEETKEEIVPVPPASPLAAAADVLLAAVPGPTTVLPVPMPVSLAAMQAPNNPPEDDQYLDDEEAANMLLNNPPEDDQYLDDEEAANLLLGTPPDYPYWQERESWWNKPMSSTFKTAVYKSDFAFLNNDHLITGYPEPSDNGTPSSDLYNKEFVDAMNFAMPPHGFYDLEGGPSALGMAAKSGDVQVARRLLELRADPNHTFIEDVMSESYRSTLELAVIFDNYELAKLLLESGADPNRRYCGTGYALLMQVVDPRGIWHPDFSLTTLDGISRIHFAPLLVAHGANIDYPGLINRMVQEEDGMHMFPNKESYLQALRLAKVPEKYLML